MPWGMSDIGKHNKGLSKSQKKKWLSVANGVYKKCMTDNDNDKKCAPMAIRIANASVKSGGKRKI